MCWSMGTAVCSQLIYPSSPWRGKARKLPKPLDKKQCVPQVRANCGTQIRISRPLSKERTVSYVDATTGGLTKITSAALA